MLGRVNLNIFALSQHFAGQRVKLDDALHLVAPELDADTDLLIGRQNLHGVSSDTETATGQIEVVTLVLHVDQLTGQLRGASGLSLTNVGHETLILFRRSEAEYAGDRGDDKHVAPGQQGASGRVPELVQLLVDVGVLFDV